MPLGKLSRNQIEKAYKVLTELSDLIASGGSTTALLDATTRFYTLIPHDFGLNKPPLLDDAGVIKSKREMLDSLLEIEIAYSLMKSGPEEDPMDSYYKKLNTEIQASVIILSVFDSRSGRIFERFSMKKKNKN